MEPHPAVQRKAERNDWRVEQKEAVQVDAEVEALEGVLEEAVLDAVEEVLEEDLEVVLEGVPVSDEVDFQQRGLECTHRWMCALVVRKSGRRCQVAS